MTENELKIFAEAVLWLKQYDDANPEVGMGPSMEMLVDRIAKRVGIKPTNQEATRIKRMVMEWIG